MKFLICFAILFAFISLAYADSCSYNYCLKDELHVCEESEDRIQCNQKGGLFVTYRKNAIWPASHKCCVGWKIEHLDKKNLYCVRNVRDSRRKCSTESSERYDFKFSTLCKETFTCI